MGQANATTLVLQIIHNDPEQAAEETLNLRDDLLERNLGSVELLGEEGAHDGMAIDPITLGVLVAVAPIAVTKLLEFLNSYALARANRQIELEVTLDAKRSARIKVPATASPEELRRWIGTVKEALGTKDRQR